MITESLLADIEFELDAEGLVDRALIARAEKDLVTAEERQRVALAKVDDAELNVAVARNIAAGMIGRAFAGEDFTAEDVVAAQDSARQAEIFAAFCSAVARNHVEPVERVKAALADARDMAWRLVIVRAVDLRIEAAAKADRARLVGQRGANTSPQDIAWIEGTKTALFAAAQPLFERGNAMIELACINGARMDLRQRVDKPQWPSSEERERRHWNRPLSLEEIINAAA